VALAVSLVSLVGETIADEQQWRFQSVKYNPKLPRDPSLGDDYTKGFLTHGLFRFCRHPNFFCEQTFWVGVYLFSVAATGNWFGWCGLGAAVLVCNFHFSTGFSEGLSAKKYPAYKEYQSNTSRLLPWFPAPSKTKAT